MEELNLLRKKTGMTIAKAWILMVSAVLLFIVSVFVVALISKINKRDISDFVHTHLSWIMISVFSVCSLWGFNINKRELPFFQKPSFAIIITCMMIAIAWSYVSPIVGDLLPFSERESKNVEISAKIEIFLGLLITLIFTVLQIGIIGHGLLKNYFFKQVLFTVAAVSMVLVVPQAVIGLLFQTVIIFYVYYRTASFQLPLLMASVLTISEETFKFLYGDSITSKNYIRINFMPNETSYHMGIIACLGIIIGGLYFIKSKTTTIAWQRPEEDENLTFL